MRGVLGLAGLALLAGCTATPLGDTAGRALPIRDANDIRFFVAERFKGEVNPSGLALRETGLGDAQLKRLIAQATADNVDLAQALARVEQAQAQARATGANRLPSLDASATITRRRIAGTGQQPTATVTDIAPGLVSAWEIDLFGRLKAQRMQAEATFRASQADRDALMVAVTAQTANAYLDWIGGSARLARLRDALAAQQDLAGLARARARAGLVPELDARRAEALAARTAASLGPLQLGIDTALTRLAVLTGTTPASLSAVLTTQPLPVLPQPLPTLAVSDLLARPDVMRAAAQVEAADAGLAEAIFNRLPRLTLSASIGLSADAIDNLFKSAAQTFTLSPTLSTPLFDGGRRQSEIVRTRAVIAERNAALRQTVLLAVEETEVSMAAIFNRTEEVAARRVAISADADALALARSRYLAGIEDMTATLDALAQLGQSQDSELIAHTAALKGHVDLWRSLGGR